MYLSFGLEEVLLERLQREKKDKKTKKHSLVSYTNNNYIIRGGTNHALIPVKVKTEDGKVNRVDGGRVDG